MNFLKALYRFFTPWPEELFSKAPGSKGRTKRQFKYWRQLHGGTQGGSFVVLWFIFTGFWAGPMYDWIRPMFPSGLAFFHFWPITGYLAVAIPIYCYGILLLLRLYRLVWKKLDPWFESKYHTA